jgi:hypothetical protein
MPPEKILPQQELAARSSFADTCETFAGFSKNGVKR